MLLLFWILADLVLLARPRCTQHTGTTLRGGNLFNDFDVFSFVTPESFFGMIAPAL